jgi:uncharacterized delta-60 repeat protein
MSLVLAPLLYQPTTAQVLDPTFTLPTGLYAVGGVNALGPAQADGRRLVGGYFTRVNGVGVSNLVRLDAAGALDVTFSQNVGAVSGVYCIQGLDNGKYLLGADANFGESRTMVTAGGLTRAGLLRLNADGTADASFNAGTGPHPLASYQFEQEVEVQADGKILVAGSFDSFNGKPANGLVRLNADGSVDPSFNVGTGPGLTFYKSPPIVRALASLPNGKVLVAGEFDSFNGQTTHSVVRLNADGTVDASFASVLAPAAIVGGLAVQPDGKVLVTGGFFTNTNNEPGITRLTTTGARDASFTPPAYTNTFLGSFPDAGPLLQPDGKILLSGYLLPTGTTKNNFVRLNPNGTEDTSFKVVSGQSEAASVIGLQADGTILVGGNFNTFNGMETSLGRLTSTGAPDPAFVPSIQQPGIVTAMVRQTDGQLLLAGDFIELSGQHVHRLVRLTAVGTLDAAYAAAVGLLPSQVTSLALQADGKLLAGTVRGVGRFLISGAPDPAFTSFSDQAYVVAVAVQPDGKIMVGGVFQVQANGSYYRNLVRLSSNGTLDPGFVVADTQSDIPYIINNNALLVQPDGRVVVAGLVFGSSGQQGKLLRYETTGALDASFSSSLSFAMAANNSNSYVYLSALALQADGKLLVGGHFDAVDGAPRANLARLTATGAVDAGFVPPASLTGDVSALAVQPNGRVLVGGSFTTGAYTNLVRVLPTGTLDTSFAPTANPTTGSDYSTVRTLLVQPDGGVLLGGFFTAVGGQLAFGVARLMAPNVLAVAAPGAVASRAGAWPVPARTLLHVQPDARAQPRTLELLDGLGRVVRSRPVVASAEQVLDVASLPAGIYLLRVHYSSGTVSQRVAVE